MHSQICCKMLCARHKLLKIIFTSLIIAKKKLKNYLNQTIERGFYKRVEKLILQHDKAKVFENLFKEGIAQLFMLILNGLKMENLLRSSFRENPVEAGYSAVIFCNYIL